MTLDKWLSEKTVILVQVPLLPISLKLYHSFIELCKTSC